MRRWFYGKVVKYRKAIMAVFVLAAIASAVMYPKVYVDYDILNYLPQDSPSTIAIDVMKEEFGGNLPNTQAVIRDVDMKDIKEYKSKLEAIDGVLSVQWADSIIPLDIPLDMMPASMLDSFYRDGNALFIITVDEDKQLQTVPAIYDLIGEDNLLTGNCVISVVATINSVKEILVITIIAIIFLLFVLAITTTSWVEPLIVLIGLGIAVVINAGTNIILGKISFVTNASGMILQMAVALDYSVFLIHRFSECKKNAEPEEAMVEALTLSSSSIMSSGLTTVIGFLALATMRFLIGADLGITLSKGVAISLITTLMFMPGVILSTYKWMEKTQHRSFMPSFTGFGKFVRKVTFPMVIVFLIAMVPSFIGSMNNDYWYGGSRIYGPDTRVGSDGVKMREIFGNNDSYVLMVPRGSKTAEYALVREIKEHPKVKTVLSPVSALGSFPAEVLPDSIIDQLRSEKYDRIVINAAVPAEGEETFSFLDDIYAIGDKYYPGEYHLAGGGASNYDLKKVVTGDTLKVNLVAILAVFLVLVFAMQNLLLPLILVLTIETAIWVNMSLSLITGSTLYYISYLIVSSIQLGATVDYAILFTQRYRENRNVAGLSPGDSVVQTIRDNTVSIMTSAIAVAVMGFLLSTFSTQGMIAQVGMLLGRGTLCSLFAVIFVLPGLLMTFDRLVIHSFGFKQLFHKEKV